MREHTYSQAQLRGFEQAQLWFDESWQHQLGVPYGCVPPDGFRVRRARRAAAALRVPCAIAWWVVRIACVVVAVPFFVLFAVCVVAAMCAPFRL
jgi:hypothetical protein